MKIAGLGFSALTAIAALGMPARHVDAAPLLLLAIALFGAAIALKRRRL